MTLRVIVVALLTAAPGLAQPPAPSTTATIKIRVPALDAQLSVDSALTNQAGLNREFVTPVLTPGKRYAYTFTATWEPNNYTKITRTRKVEFTAGDTVTLDMREKDPTATDDIIIRYVPTPQNVVEEMLKLGGVKKGDVVYDLGCGDGRIVVTAVAEYGADRGVGVDIDPKRIAESKQRAKDAGVEDRVEIRKADILKIDDYGDASVVMLYLGNEMNAQLRPMLQKVLKPGSRIVSHRFTMGDWKPDKSITVTDDVGTEYKLHLWTIE